MRVTRFLSTSSATTAPLTEAASRRRGRAEVDVRLVHHDNAVELRRHGLDDRVRDRFRGRVARRAEEDDLGARGHRGQNLCNAKGEAPKK